LRNPNLRNVLTVFARRRFFAPNRDGMQTDSHLVDKYLLQSIVVTVILAVFIRLGGDELQVLDPKVA